MLVTMTENPRSRTWSHVSRLLPTFILLGAIYFWFCYVAQGIAYGDLFGIAGREGDLAVIASHAREFLGIALFFEALAVAMIAWFCTRDVQSLWQRLCFCVVLSLVLDFCTYAVIRGF
jgi:hypothetical protein